MRCRTRSVLAFLVVLMCGSAGATTFDVQTFFDVADSSPGDGWCMTTIGLCTLRAAVQEANLTPGDDVINLPAEHYILTISGQDEDDATTGDLDVLDNVSIYGEGAEVTIVDADAIDRVFDLHTGILELVGLTVTGGSAITSTTSIGGGIQATGSLLTMGACRVVGNTANLGGGIYGSAATDVQISDTLLEGNSAQDLGYVNPWGAAIRAQGGLSLSSSTVSNNVGAGDGYFAVDAQCYSGAVSVLNTTIVSNQASALGTYNCDVLVLHTTIADNATYGLALGSYDNSHQRTVTNTIVVGHAYDCNMAADAAVSFEYSLDGDGTCAPYSGPGYQSATDPLLLPLRNWGGLTPTMYPRPVVSPVIDTGSTTACYIVDQRGEVRGSDGNGDGIPGCELGAVEAGDLLFYDGFEDSTTGAWSATTGPAATIVETGSQQSTRLEYRAS
jgi:hypothetical protein